MRRILFLVAAICTIQTASAQVGINNTDPKAQLDISAGATASEMDGLLIPRLDEFPTGVGTDQNGMLVFMTGGGAPTKGFYYWDQGIPAWVPFQGSSSNDSDWFVANTTTASNNINDNIYTLGGVSIGTNTTASNSTLYIATDLANSYGIYTETENGTTESMVAINNISTLDGTGDYRAISNSLGGTTSGNNIAITNTITNDGAGSKTAVLNSISSDFGERIGLQNSFFAGAGNATGFYNVITNGTQDGIIHGVRNTITAAGDGRRYGIRNDISGTGTGVKYGTYNRIGNTSGGIHYGVYSDVQKATGYAGYFIGRTSLGIGTSNRYLLPETDGTAGQVMTTDGSGQLSFNSILGDGSGNDWTITGNTGTNPSSNFIGTIDAQDLSIRTENTEKIRITTQGQIETYNTGNSVFIGESAGANDDLANRQNIAIGFNALRDNITGARNIGIGSGALYASTGGTANIAIGDDAMVANESGNSNVGLGIQTLFKNTIGNNNTAYGGTAMRENTDGSNNTALGFRALYNNTTTNGNVAVGFDAGFENIAGTNNTYLGFNAGHLNMGDRSVFIGANSGSNELGSNKLYIENSNADADNALIYGEFDNDILRTNGELQVGNPTGTGYAFPTIDGTSGQVLSSDGAGQLTFTNATVDTQNTLDQAYDEGGAGLGRIITADAGAISIEGEDGFQITGTFGSGDNIALSGAGTRLFFNPRKAAFRAGNVSSTQWNDANIGDYSFATGRDNRASGVYASGLGFSNVSSGEYATAFGRNNTASGDHSVAGSINNTASGLASVAFGNSNTSSGDFATTFGSLNIASGARSFIAGTQNTATGYTSSAFGVNSTASGTASAAMGNSNIAHSAYETVLGSFSTNYTAANTNAHNPSDRVFTVGNGVSDITRSNALTIYKSGLININDAYNLPLADGTNGQALITDGAGQLSFGTAANIEKIDDLSDGKSDSDGTQDGSSIFLGVNAGAADNSDNNRNVGIGYLAMEDNLDGSQNTAIGHFALLNNIDGSANTAVGAASLDANTSGIWNTAVGQASLSANVDGAYNTAVGRSALAGNADGNSNVAIGVNAYQSNTSGSFNTVIGVDAATGLTASSNTIIGRRAMNSYTAGGENVAIGSAAGYYGSGIQNTFLGTSAGNLVGTGERNGSVFVGYGAGSNEANSDRLYIENSAADADNALIYGEFDNNILRTNSEFQIGNPTVTGYALPTNQGAANDVLTSNGDGTTQWAAGGATMAQVMANPLHPDGFTGFTPITHQLGGGDYTVPSGKNLYITMYTPLGATNLQINSSVIAVSINNQGYSKLPNPIIAGDGDVVSISNLNGVINGYLVDAAVAPITQDISSGSYTVPANKNFVILSVSSDSALSSNIAQYLINGEFVYLGKGNAYGSNTVGFYGPIFLGAGDIISANNTASINGYLVDN